MSKSILLTAACLLLPAAIRAQGSLGYNIEKYAGMKLSPGQTVTDNRRTMNLDIENTAAYAARDLGAPVDLMFTDTARFAMLHKTERNIVAASVSNVNNSGSYLHYDGRRHTYGNIVAGGELHLPGAGTLYGMAAYSNGGSRGISLSYALHPEDVAPYFVSDSISSATMHREVYTVAGGYSLSLGSTLVGVDALYEGIAQSRSHDPRHSNYSHFIRIGLSAARLWGDNMLGLKVMPEWTRQSISANSIQDGIKFFDFYGFGQFNRRESLGALSYGRQQTTRGIGAQALYMYGGAWDVTLNAGWRYRRLQTEEYNFKDLFATRTHHLWEQAVASKRSGAWTTIVQLSASQQRRKGEENVYQQQLQDQEQGLYDYVKVGSNKLYTLTTMDADLRVKEAVAVAPATSVFVLGAATWRHYEEKYKVPLRKITNQTLTATVAAGFSHRRGHVEMEATMHAAVQGGWDNKYSMAGSMTDFQRVMAFTPYQLRGENNQQLGLTVLAARSLGRKASAPAIGSATSIASAPALGFKATVAYLNSDYRKQVAFEAGLFATF